jgi:hypothetical protein
VLKILIVKALVVFIVLLLRRLIVKRLDNARKHLRAPHFLSVSVSSFVVRAEYVDQSARKLQTVTAAEIAHRAQS